MILVYDVTDRKSLNDLSSWIEELHMYADKNNIVGLVLGNKIDEVILLKICEEIARYRNLFLWLYLNMKMKISALIAWL